MDNMDSIEVRIPDEIREYKEKYGGFTFRQWIGIVLVMVVCVPTYYVLFEHTPQTFAMIVTTIIAAPIGLVFFIPINGMNAEKMIPYFKRMFVDFGTVLKFQTEAEQQVERELLGDKKYQKKMKKLKKMEKKNQKRIQRGSATEENEKLREYRADVDAYYNALRKEKIDKMMSSKISDVAIAVNTKEQKRLKKETSLRHKESKFVAGFEEEEAGFSEEERFDRSEYANAYQANSLRNSLDDKESIVMPMAKQDFEEDTMDFESDLLEVKSSCEDAEMDSRLVSRGNERYSAVQEDIVSRDDTVHGASVLEDKCLSEQKDCSWKEDSKNVMEESPISNEVSDRGDKPTQTVAVNTSGLSKRQLVLQFYRTHPNATKADCKAATGVEMRTIKRCWPKD